MSSIYGALFDDTTTFKVKRSLHPTPFKISLVKSYDMPGLVEDFYSKQLCLSNGLIGTTLGNQAYCSLVDENGKLIKIQKVCTNESSEYSLECIGISESHEIAISHASGWVHMYKVTDSGVRLVDACEPNNAPYCNLTWKENILYCGAYDGRVNIIDSTTGDQISHLRLPYTNLNKVCGLLLSNDGNILCVGCNSNQVYVYDVRMNRGVLRSLEHEAAIKAMCWDEDGKTLYSGSGNACPEISLWDVNTGSLIRKKNVEHQVTGVHKYNDNIIVTRGMASHSDIVLDKNSGHIKATLNYFEGVQKTLCSEFDNENGILYSAVFAKDSGDHILAVTDINELPTPKKRKIDAKPSTLSYYDLR
jgi:WD40 repeat protein